MLSEHQLMSLIYQAKKQAKSYQDDGKIVSAQYYQEIVTELYTMKRNYRQSVESLKRAHGVK